MTVREDFYNKIPDFWADMYGEEYALYDIHTLEQSEVDKIREATQRVGAIFFKTAKLLRVLDDESLIELGFPTTTIPFIRLMRSPLESVIARLDLIPTDNGYKCIELNADTPTFIKELFHVNEIVCEEFNRYNPNQEEEARLKRYVNKSIEMAIQEANTVTPHVVFVADKSNIEDYNTAKYLMSLTKYSKLIDVSDLTLKYGLGVYDDEGKKIDVLYRQTLPIENIIMDKDAEGNPIGEWLLEMVEFNKVQLINPPSAFLLQNKSIMAVIWGLHVQENPFFTEEEHGWIAEYFLPTYLDAEYFTQNQLPYVQKTAFGREGDTVTVYDASGKPNVVAEARSYEQYLYVYQQYVDLPTTKVQSAKGLREGHLLVGSFLIGGEASAFGYRLGDKITDNMAHYLPVCVN